MTIAETGPSHLRTFRRWTRFHREILGLVLLGSLKPVVAGLAIGVVAALGLTRWLSGLVDGISPTDPITFVSRPLVRGVVAAGGLEGRLRSEI